MADVVEDSLKAVFAAECADGVWDRPPSLYTLLGDGSVIRPPFSPEFWAGRLAASLLIFAKGFGLIRIVVPPPPASAEPGGGGD